MNAIGDKQCHKCQTKKQVATKTKLWKCKICGKLNPSRKHDRCKRCRLGIETKAMTLTWSCKSCNTENPNERRKC